MAEQISADSLAAGICADIDAIEMAFVAQWTNYGHAPGGVFHDDDDLVWTEAPVAQLPYNAVLCTRLGSNAAERIAQVVGHFRQRAVEFLWLVHPTVQPTNLAEQLAAQGLSLVEQATGMALDLTGWIAYRDSQPVGKAYMSYLGCKDTAAIFGVYVRPNARGHGIASKLTTLAITRAAALGRRRVVLHSSETAVHVYQRLGFVERCTLPMYATTALHGMQPI